MKKAFSGQITVEAMMLAAIMMSILLIAAFAVSRMQNWEQALFERRIINMQLGDIIRYADEICVLGAGNSRTMSLSPIGFKLTAYGRTLTASGKNFNISRDALCHVDADIGTYKNRIYLWYEKNTDDEVHAYISQNPKP